MNEIMNLDFWELVALVASIVLPFFNIPLIVKIIKQKSSKDLSLIWVLGVFTCFILMAPDGVRSEDFVFRTFTVVNLTFFSVVTFVTLKYRHGPNQS